ncbi:acyl-CoA dehydrogenase family protein [Sciscionella marina]|uniref:acyl-CoA dehydrogenase family protein n=1 Tax=Sciscionella marina TaxID=508770 RepID=UPI00038188F1|nr:acyl-CoA dehydrogenase family protein [Sciscionella marina]
MDEDEFVVFRESLRSFVGREVLPHADSIAASGSVPADVFGVAGENGYLGICAPEEYGGSGISDIAHSLVVAEELAEAGQTGLALAFAAHGSVAVPYLANHGSHTLRERWLPPMVTGTVLAAFAGDGAEGIRLSSAGTGVRIDGTLESVVSATRSGLLFVPVGIDEGAARVVAIPRETAGVRSIAIKDSLAVPGADMGTIELDGVFVESEAVQAVSTATLASLRADDQLALAHIAVAGARAALATTLNYVRERSVFSRPLADFQNTRYALAEISAELLVTSAYLRTCAVDRAENRLSVHQAEAARLRCADLFALASDQGLQLHGGYGYMREYSIAAAFADARYLRLHGGGTRAAKEALAANLGL